jgi:glycerol-3-phosphate dehydrogenase
MAPLLRARNRFIRPLAYITGASAAGAGVLYLTYRPRDIPGSDPAAVPPPIYGEGGKFHLPHFPNIQGRDAMISELLQSSVANQREKSTTGMVDWIWGTAKEKKLQALKVEENDEPFDLLVIGGGATGTGIALDAATRGLKVAVVEREDFSSGTSSKSTKLVHGGVRYLEKAVWELDYSQ